MKTEKEYTQPTIPILIVSAMIPSSLFTIKNSTPDLNTHEGVLFWNSE